MRATKFGNEVANRRKAPKRPLDACSRQFKFEKGQFEFEREEFEFEREEFQFEREGDAFFQTV